MLHYPRTLLTIAITASLAACGGGGGDGSPSGDGSPNIAITKSGKVIDGYISGATVFLDLNFNGKLDSGEPNAPTDENGDFNLGISSTLSECAQYVPTVTHVPVGATDSDYPDTPIEEEYTMVSPPSFAMTTNEDLLNLTPLTSIVWNSVEMELINEGTELSCETIVAQEHLREDIMTRLEQQELRVAQRYNVTVDDLYGDYVASANTELHQMAQALVPGLQASYVETVELEKQNQDADIVFVEYFLGLYSSNSDKYGDNWYRREFIQTSNGNFNSATHLVSEDLANRLSVFDQYQMVTTVRNGVNIEQTINLEKADSNYTCAVSEWLETTLEQSSGVRNTIYGTAIDWEDCINVTGDTTQSLVTKDYQNSDLISYTEHVYNAGNDSGFSNLIGITGSVTQDDLTPVRDVIDTDFNSTEGHGADFWMRVTNESTTDGTNIMYTHTSADSYTVQEFYTDGTNTKRCGTWSSGGSDLSNCTE